MKQAFNKMSEIQENVPILHDRCKLGPLPIQKRIKLKIVHRHKMKFQERKEREGNEGK
jgi:hypothetical protein